MNNSVSFSNDDVVNALNTIKEICSKNNCKTCPFFNDGLCVVSSVVPREWVIANESGRPIVSTDGLIHIST